MKLALIQCSSKKKDYSCLAEELYSASTLFRYSLKYVKGKYDKVGILSAKYGLVELNDKLEPYNLCLNNFNKNELEFWSLKTAEAIISKFPEITECHFYVGKNYRKKLIPILEEVGINCYSYLEHLGIGSKVSWFKKEIERNS